MNLQYLIHLANYSDGVLYILGILLLVELAVMVDRFWYLRRTILRGLVFVQELGSHGRLDRETLNKMTESAGDLPEATLLRMAASHHGQVKGEALASRLEESVLVLAPQLDRRLWLLDTIITLAPLLGLFGT
ncbi:MAG: MotA/TolQ/ExbB proton channel family protein, partial [Acidithiobacillus sp.]